MLRRQRGMLLQLTFYALVACVILSFGRVAWYERMRDDHGNVHRSVWSVDPFATLHLPFAALPPQVIHLGVDTFPITHLRSPASPMIGKCTAMHGTYDHKKIFPHWIPISDIVRYTASPSLFLTAQSWTACGRKKLLCWQSFYTRCPSQRMIDMRTCCRIHSGPELIELSGQATLSLTQNKPVKASLEPSQVIAGTVYSISDSQFGVA